MELFSKILEKFTIAQRIWALIILVVCVLAYAGIQIAPDIFGKHNCSECRQDIRQCNQEYAELASTVREYIRIREEYVQNRSFKAVPVEDLPPAEYNNIQTVETVPVDTKDEKTKALDKMKNIALKQ